jgi:manganese transport protein
MSKGASKWLPEPPPLPEVRTRIPLPTGPSVLRKLLTFAGPGFLIAVGYMDPGNWATDLAAATSWRFCCKAYPSNWEW